jgi:hypothetical protein
MRRLGIGLQRSAESIGSDGPVRRVPDAASVDEQERLWRLVPHTETFRDGVRQFAILKHENDATVKIGNSFHEMRKVFVDLGADRTLRAMLENEDGLGFRPLKELFEIVILF